MPPTVTFSLGGLDFEWDSDKALDNWYDHAVTFEEAAASFLDAFRLAGPDLTHSRTEDRWKLVARAADSRLLTTAYTQRGHRYRLISAWPATKRERYEYEDTPR